MPVISARLAIVDRQATVGTAAIARQAMRIAYFTDTTQIGGAERHLADLAAGALRAGHQVTVVAPQPDLLDFVHAAAPPARLIKAGDDSYTLAPSMGARAGSLVRSLPELTRTFARARPDLVHVNNGGYPGSDLCRLAPLAAAAAGVRRRLMTVNSMPWPRGYSQPQLQALVDVVLWRSVEAVVCPAQAVGRDLVALRGLPPSMLRHVRYGVAEPAQAAKATLALRRRLAPADEVLVGMVSARPVPEKGYHVFLEALAATNGPVRGVLVGPSPGPEFAHAVRHLGLEGRLAQEGAVRPVDPYYHALDLLVMPSTAEECMPLVILEAMAAGKPVLSSRLAGAPEAVVDGETGRLFAPGSSRELAGLIGQLAADRETRERMGRAGHERWRQNFSPETQIDDALRLYGE